LQNGNYTVIATATDNNGLTGSATTSVTISKQPSPLVTKILSPRAQIVAGTAPSHVKCSQGYGLVLNTFNSRPACIKSEHIAKFLSMGWGHLV